MASSFWWMLSCCWLVILMVSCWERLKEVSLFLKTFVSSSRLSCSKAIALCFFVTEVSSDLHCYISFYDDSSYFLRCFVSFSTLSLSALMHSISLSKQLLLMSIYFFKFSAWSKADFTFSLSSLTVLSLASSSSLVLW
jgi:hypothetical protein